MDEDRDAAIRTFVEASARLTGMPLGAGRLDATAAVMSRIAVFAADVGAFELGDDVEIVGPTAL